MKDPNTTAAATLRALLEKRTGLTASSAAAQAVWLAVRKTMLSRGGRKSVRALEQAETTASLDTWDREVVLDGVAVALTTLGCWPCNGDSQETSRRFARELAAGLQSHGWAAQVAAAPQGAA